MQVFKLVVLFVVVVPMTVLVLLMITVLSRDMVRRHRRLRGGPAGGSEVDSRHAGDDEHGGEAWWGSWRE
ncbi:hypothetical protein [Streptacidiphilus sp. MAP5-3]|uniref:hypothetical protein n=1 Tax=unclassified Streptacidiphilus TaxID=2643834 RepID=UPI003519C435